MKKVIFALCAAVLAYCFVWCLWTALQDATAGYLPAFVETGIVFVGVPLVLVGFIVGMRKLGKVAMRWGFEGYSPAFLFVTGFFYMLIRSYLLGKFATIDIQVHDTIFVLAGGHTEMGVAILLGMIAGVYFYYPRIVHRPLHRGLGYCHFWMTVVGMFLFFNAANLFMDALVPFPMRAPRGWTQVSSRYYYWNAIARAALLLLLPGQLVFVFNLVYSGLRRKMS